MKVVDDKIVFLNKIEEHITTGHGVSISMSKNKDKSNVLKKIQIISYKDQGKIHYKATETNLTNDVTKTLTAHELIPYISERCGELFLHCILDTGDAKYELLTSKKGKSKLLGRTPSKQTLQHQEGHNKTKNYLIPEDAPFLIHLDISSTNGKVYSHSQRKYRQINKFVEIVKGLIGERDNKSIRIADMGCGKAYLSFALFSYLKEEGYDVNLTGYDIRLDVVSKANEIANILGFEGLKFEQGDISSITLSEVDMIIALHACDIATDMAIFQGVQAGAQYIILSPCCHKQIRKQITLKNALTHHGTLLERQAEIITDAIRSLLLEYSGYKTKVFEFISSEHTSKNLMITGTRAKANPAALKEVKELKKHFGIEYHYLENLLNICQ